MAPTAPDTEWRFLHAADLHLDAPFRSLLADATMPAALRATLADATFRAFENCIASAIRLRVRLVLFAGDIDNAGEQSVRARAAFRLGMERLAKAGIAAVAVRGNHDPWSAASSASVPGVRFLGTEPESVTLEGTPAVTVHGASHATVADERNLAVRIDPAPDDGAFHIGLLHCHLATAQGSDRHGRYAACSVADLERADMRYWALGHVHTPWTGGDAACPIVYPGCLQGLHINEAGAHGAVLVTVRDGRVAGVERVELDSVRWHSIDIPITDCATPEEWLESAADAARALRPASGGRSIIARLRVTGRGTLFSALRDEAARAGLLSHLRLQAAADMPDTWFESLQFQAASLIDRATLEADPASIIGEVFRQEVALRTSDAGAIRDILAAESAGTGGLARRLRTLLESASDEELAALLARAADIVADRLHDPDETA